MLLRTLLSTCLLFCSFGFSQGTGGPGGSGGGGGGTSACTGKPTLDFDIEMNAEPFVATDVGECDLSNQSNLCTFTFSNTPADQTGDYTSITLLEEHTCYYGAWKLSKQDILYSGQVVTGDHDEDIENFGGRNNINLDANGILTGDTSRSTNDYLSISHDNWVSAVLVEHKSSSFSKDYLNIDGDQQIESLLTHTTVDFNWMTGELIGREFDGLYNKVVNSVSKEYYGVLIYDSHSNSGKIMERKYTLADLIKKEGYYAERLYTYDTPPESVSVGMTHLEIANITVNGSTLGYMQNLEIVKGSKIIDANYQSPFTITSSHPLFNEQFLESSVQAILDDVNDQRSEMPRLKNWGTDDVFFPQLSSDVLLNSGPGN